MRELFVAAIVLCLAHPGVELRPRSEPWQAGERLAPDAREEGQGLALAYGALLGELVLSDEWRDARGHRVAAGRYELRYVAQPRLKDHFGLASVRDFALLVPAGGGGAGDWIARSRHALDARHPAVMALAPAPDGASDDVRLADGRDALVARVAGLAIAFVLAPGEEAPADAF